MLALSGAAPLQEGTSIIFYANRTFCDKVSGLLGGAARPVARSIMRGEIQRLFESHTEAMSGGSGS